MTKNQTEGYYESLTHYIHNKENFVNNIHENEKNYFTLKFGLFDKDRELKNFKGKGYKTYKIGDFEKAQTYSGIIDKNNLKAQVSKLIPYSFGIWVKFKLKQPYFSRDDDEFYLIQNPILKEKVFKVPMIRGSGWKGAIAHAGREIIKENYENGKDIWENVFSYLRIFGTGNEEFRELIGVLNKNNKDYDKLKNSLAKYVLFNLRVPIKLDDDIEEIIKKCFNLNFKNIFDDKNGYYEAKKGRAIFYPTYFDRLSLEVINPHSRKTRAGTNPIHYEVVPKGTEGILQIVYIPFDGILKKNEELKKEVEQDLEFLCKCIEKVADLGVGAKTKLGWGTFEIKERFCCSKGDLEIKDKRLIEKGWGRCQ
jgi:CRISPR-associated protein Cmr2